MNQFNQLTPSVPPSYRSQSIDLQSKSYAHTQRLAGSDQKQAHAYNEVGCQKSGDFERTSVLNALICGYLFFFEWPLWQFK